MDLIKEIEQIISDYKGKAITLNEQTTFKDLKLDSLETVDLIQIIEEKFNLNFPDSLNPANLGDLIASMQKLMKKHGK